MFERKFFLGFLVDVDYQLALSSVNQRLIALYIQDSGNYLQEATFQEQRYLGCFLASPCEISHLELMEAHIYSLLKRLIPHHPYHHSTLWFFPMVEFLNKKD